MHLTQWPSAAELPSDTPLVAAMDRVRDVCSATSSIRKREGRRVRLPLTTLTIASPDAESLAPFVSVIADEVNVRTVELTTDVSAHAASVLQVVPAIAGPRIGKDVQRVIKAVRAGEWTRDGETVVAGGIALEEGEFSLRLVPADEHASAALPGADGVVVLDLSVSAEQEDEGLARDLIRAVQQARRDAGLEISDRIQLRITAGRRWEQPVTVHRELIAGETLAVGVEFVADDAATEPVVAVTRAEQPAG